PARTGRALDVARHPVPPAGPQPCGHCDVTEIQQPTNRPMLTLPSRCGLPMTRVTAAQVRAVRQWETVMSETTPSMLVRRPRVRWTGLWFLAPFLAVFAFALIAPVVYSIYLSMFQTQMIGGTSFVGVDNFVRVFQDPRFWEGIGRVTLFL